MQAVDERMDEGRNAKKSARVIFNVFSSLLCWLFCGQLWLGERFRVFWREQWRRGPSRLLQLIKTMPRDDNDNKHLPVEPLKNCWHVNVHVTYYHAGHTMLNTQTWLSQAGSVHEAGQRRESETQRQTEVERRGKRDYARSPSQALHMIFANGTNVRCMLKVNNKM